MRKLAQNDKDNGSICSVYRYRGNNEAGESIIQKGNIMMKLRGYIDVETDNAIFFHITSDEDGFHLKGRIVWFPKSKIRLPKKKDKKEISIYVPCWLYDSKIIVHESER